MASNSVSSNQAPICWVFVMILYFARSPRVFSDELMSQLLMKAMEKQKRQKGQKEQKEFLFPFALFASFASALGLTLVKDHFHSVFRTKRDQRLHHDGVAGREPQSPPLRHRRQHQRAFHPGEALADAHARAAAEREV